MEYKYHGIANSSMGLQHQKIEKLSNKWRSHHQTWHWLVELVGQILPSTIGVSCKLSLHCDCFEEICWLQCKGPQDLTKCSWQPYEFISNHQKHSKAEKWNWNHELVISNPVSIGFQSRHTWWPIVVDTCSSTRHKEKPYPKCWFWHIGKWIKNGSSAHQKLRKWPASQFGIPAEWTWQSHIRVSPSAKVWDKPITGWCNKILKNMSSSMGRIMENKKCLKPPTRIILVQRPINWDMGPQNVSYSDLFSSFEFQLISQHTPFLIRSVGGSQFYFVFFVSTLQKYQSIGNHDQVEKNETTNIDQPALLSKHSSFIQFLGCSIQLTNVHT